MYSIYIHNFRWEERKNHPTSNQWYQEISLMDVFRLSQKSQFKFTPFYFGRLLSEIHKWCLFSTHEAIIESKLQREPRSCFQTHCLHSIVQEQQGGGAVSIQCTLI